MNLYCKIIMLVLCLTLCSGWLDPFKDAVSEGNKEFHNGNYAAARQKYEEAESFAPNEEAKRRLAFNKGTADYMAGDYEGAINLFHESAGSEDAEVQKKSLFNMGNAFLKMNKKQEAFEAYRNALKIDPNYAAPRNNIEYMVKENEQNKDKEDKDKDKGDKDGDDKQQKQDDKQNQKDNKDGDNKQDKQNEKNDQKENRNGNQNEQNESNAGKMSKEQIKNILDSMKSKPVQRTKGNENGPRYTEKDW